MTTKVAKRNCLIVKSMPSREATPIELHLHTKANNEVHLHQKPCNTFISL